MGRPVTLQYIEGPAGSGKTTALITDLQQYLSQHPPEPFQKVLGLSMMHGARRRLEARLGHAHLPCTFVCSTFDSFAWRLVNRWASFARKLVGTDWRAATSDFDETCRLAARMLDHHEVREWVAATFPVVVVDEAQDCTGGRLGIIKQLVRNSTTLVAADEFQDLSGALSNEAVTWLRSRAQPQVLTKVHRTEDQGLLAAANSVRNGAGFLSGRHCTIRPEHNENTAAHAIGRHMLTYNHYSPVILSPVHPGTSDFVQRTIERLQSRPIRPFQRDVGPFKVYWAPNVDSMVQILRQRVGLDEMGERDIVREDQMVFDDGVLGAKELKKWVKTQCTLRDVNALAVSEIVVEIRTICQRIHSLDIGVGSGIRAMTIHQAKNQEFPHVILLWPYQVPSDDEKKRRLLYNAITRATTSFSVLVQDPGGRQRRTNLSPFR